MSTTKLTPEALDTATAVAGSTNQPIYMLNLLRYNDRAAYPENAGLAPCSGREAYFERYVPAFSSVAQGSGIKPVWIGKALTGIVAPADEHWDDVAIVEYPSFAVFRALVESDAYKTQADPHRSAALADWRLIATSKTDLPG